MGKNRMHGQCCFTSTGFKPCRPHGRWESQSCRPELPGARACLRKRNFPKRLPDHFSPFSRAPFEPRAPFPSVLLFKPLYPALSLADPPSFFRSAFLEAIVLGLMLFRTSIPGLCVHWRCKPQCTKSLRKKAAQKITARCAHRLCTHSCWKRRFRTVRTTGPYHTHHGRRYAQNPKAPEERSASLSRASYGRPTTGRQVEATG
jgi:hypothetical protein